MSDSLRLDWISLVFRNLLRSVLFAFMIVSYWSLTFWLFCPLSEALNVSCFSMLLQQFRIGSIFYVFVEFLLSFITDLFLFVTRSVYLLT